MSLDAPTLFEQEFLVIRAKLLETAAALDRLGRAEGSVEKDPRRGQIARAIDVLASDRDNRAQTLQMVFSRPYEEDWRSHFEV